MKRFRVDFSTFILVGIMIVGIGLIAYPSVSDYWNSFHQSRAIANYSNVVADMSDDDYQKMISEARAYNEKIAQNGIRWNLTEEDVKEYNSLLNIGDTGVMGYIEINKINCILPIYHGTEESILQIAIGHIPGTSLPIGGKSTHSVLSGHRGLPSARLFTDLDRMEYGDTFVVRILDETMTYMVDRIEIVEPDDLTSLKIEEGKDYMTLVTCTPYGINTHRLLVRGHRVENALDVSSIRVTADALQLDPLVVAPAIAIPVLTILLILVLIDTRKKQYARRFKEMREKEDDKA